MCGIPRLDAGSGEVKGVFLRGLAVMLQWAHHSILSDGSETTQCATGTEVPVLSPSTECWRFPPSPDHPPGAGAVASESNRPEIYPMGRSPRISNGERLASWGFPRPDEPGRRLAERPAFVSGKQLIGWRMDTHSEHADKGEIKRPRPTVTRLTCGRTCGTWLRSTRTPSEDAGDQCIVHLPFPL
jgi:hypothetical protein